MEKKNELGFIVKFLSVMKALKASPPGTKCVEAAVKSNTLDCNKVSERSLNVSEANCFWFSLAFRLLFPLNLLAKDRDKRFGLFQQSDISKVLKKMYQASSQQVNHITITAIQTSGACCDMNNAGYPQPRPVSRVHRHVNLISHTII